MTIMAMMRDMIMMMVIVMRMRRKNIVINDIQAWTLCPAWKKAGPPCYMVITSDRQIVSNAAPPPLPLDYLTSLIADNLRGCSFCPKQGLGQVMKSGWVLFEKKF